MGTNAQVASLRQQIKTAQEETARAQRRLEIAEDFLSHAHQEIDKLEAEARQASEIGELLLSTVVAAQELTGMVPGEYRTNERLTADDQTTVSMTRLQALCEALYQLECYANGKQPVGAAKGA